jgi:hypothetical protein
MADNATYLRAQIHRRVPIVLPVMVAQVLEGRNRSLWGEEGAYYKILFE